MAEGRTGKHPPKKTQQDREGGKPCPPMNRNGETPPPTPRTNTRHPAETEESGRDSDTTAGPRIPNAEADNPPPPA